MKIDFGKYALLKPVEHRFKENSEWYWTFRPPTSGDELELARFHNRSRVTIGREGTVREAPPSWLETAHREIALIFVETNIKDDDGRLILQPGAKVAEVEAVLTIMPHDMVMEIWYAIGETIPFWGGKLIAPIEEKNPNPPSEETTSSPS